ncbi:hypothetical protein [Bradyrhizobium sp. LHD-71]|uniref:hypothetical protein n=1 Tax=Bradyrhizobium sp. LHD-71 TaxID=3072141 RepID=UPI00280FBD62|nr:hypothetical protein [Bradyrhizobium sp. LHD-71]MDQ8730256.1 hypothetical protein [Bradyrhizobium sp. LHD-71]
MTRPFAYLIAIAAAAGLLLAMQRSTPGYAELTGPIPEAGRIGDLIETRRFDVTLETVRFARRLRFTRYGRTHERDTTGVWAVVTARLAARDESVTVNGATWRGPTGLRYIASSRAENAPGALLGRRFEPGLPPQRGLMIFEIPADQIADATLLVSETNWPRLDSEAHISLSSVATGTAAITDTLDVNGIPDD